ncbi:hypothetical protein TSAR_010840 [Trichomalopsis sarcophagae]|uniref:NADH dehydrogenase [ubiquinone] 1 alpha subcomplex subunit 8 n=1 Tax=Trichomalopsis sarcophagae TaxID=543379 RepID=A0A232EH78_9HYME|nr:hypothetical protein TSAR_010840 [Trichomalopsis sarcophagae]
MVVTENIILPNDNELNVQEVNLTFPVLQAAAFHLGKYCESKNNESNSYYNFGFYSTLNKLKRSWNLLRKRITDVESLPEFKTCLTSFEFMLCKDEEDDPRRCITEGKVVTACALEFFKKIKKHCKDEFSQYYNCIDKSSGESAFSPCVLDNMNIERPSFGYFCEVKIHDSLRTKPKSNVVMYPDAAVPLSPEEPLLSPKYNSRRIWVQ